MNRAKSGEIFCQKHPVKNRRDPFSPKAFRHKRSTRSASGSLSGQLFRSGTSIGANVEEAMAGQSRKDFVSKMAIASKEARETNYWLRVLRDSELCPSVDTSDLIANSEDMIRPHISHLSALA